MEAGGTAFSTFLADVTGDVGFYPGLKPRPHAGTAAEFIALCDREGELGVEEAEDAELQQWLGLEVELSRRREEAEIEAEAAEEEEARRSPRRRRRRARSRPPAVLPAVGAVADAGADREDGPDRPRSPRAASPGKSPVELTPDAKARLRRLAAARRDVSAFAPASGEQRKLVGLVNTILGYMQRNLCQPGQGAQFDRWWRVASALRRALEFPELTGPQRQAAFAKLMQLQAEGLFAVARQGRMGWRMPKKKKRKQRGWEEWRAYV